ncbi:uncharacterized protein [Diabrotica undecimpunctata]|uniref:uncharacterized protein n=1 Tax=Diabrotica undecimpunctata TaxID=50387 RepID=UPI003B635117
MQKYLEKKALDQLKKDEAADKKAILATGGGTFKPLLTEVGAQMLALMGNQIQPLPNSCDSASSYHASVIPEVQMELDTDVSGMIPISPVEQCTDTEPNVSVSLPGTSGVLPKKDPGTAVKMRNKVMQKKVLKTDALKRIYYKKKLEGAIIEKRTKLAAYKTEIKKQTLVDLEIKIKKKQNLKI